MKKLCIITLSFIAIIFTSCNCEHESKNPVEGTWEMISSEWNSPDTTMVFQKDDINKQLKIYTGKYYSWVHQRQINDSIKTHTTSGGAGMYTINGDTIVEILEYFPWKSGVGYKSPLTFEIKGDTMIQHFPEMEDGPKDFQGWTGTEVYIRVE